jgi:Tfp pilus assembly protein PilN
MDLRLNLATTPQANNRPFIAASAVGGAVALIALIVLAHAAYADWQSQRELRAQTAGLQQQIRASEIQQQQLAAYFRGEEAKRTLERSEFLNSLIDERSFPWTKIFTDLEKTLPAGVRVISISPRLDKGRAEVALQVAAQTDASEVQFLKAMETSKVFSGLVVTDIKQPQSSTSNSPNAPNQDAFLIELTVWYTT